MSPAKEPNTRGNVNKESLIPDLSRFTSSRVRRLSKEGSWIVVGQIASVLGSLVLIRVLTEHLDPTQYGQLALGLTVAGLINQVVTGGITAGIGRFYSIAAENQDLPGYIRASRCLMVYATLAVVAIGLVLMIGLFWLGYSQWMGLAAAALILSVLSSYNASLSAVQNAARQRAIVAFHGGLDAWLKIILALCVLLWLGNSSTAVVIGYAFSSLFVTGSQFFCLRRLIPRQKGGLADSTQWIRLMWMYSWPMMVAGLFNWGYYASQRWALELFTTTNQLGQFYALTQIAYTPISLAGAMFLSFLSPILFAKAGDATDHERLINTHHIILRVAAVGLSFTVTIAIVSFIAHDLIFRLMVAADYRDMSIFMPYVVLAAGILQVSQTIANIVVIEKQTRRFLPLSIIGNGIVALMNLYFTSRWGIGGLITSMVAGATIHLLWMIQIVSANVKNLRRSGTSSPTALSL